VVGFSRALLGLALVLASSVSAVGSYRSRHLIDPAMERVWEFANGGCAPEMFELEARTECYALSPFGILYDTCQATVAHEGMVYP